MRTKKYLGALNGIAQDESGSSTVEFVILFPAVLLLIVAIAATSIHIATISDVQQVASDLTRQSLRYANMGYDEKRICSELHEEVLPTVAGSLVFVNPSRFTAPICDLQEGSSRVLVMIDYDLSETPLKHLAGFLGFEIDTVRRRSSLVF